MMFRNLLKKASDYLLAPKLPGFFIDNWSKTLNKGYRFTDCNLGFFPTIDTVTLGNEGVVQVYDKELTAHLPTLEQINKSLKTSKQAAGSFKNYMSNVINPWQSDKDHSSFDKNFISFLDIATRQNLVKSVEKTFGPMELVGGGIYITDAKKIDLSKLAGSQKWHLDRFSNKHVKVFINLTDIGSSDGPTLILKRGACDKLMTGTARIKSLISRKYRHLIYSRDIKSGIPIDISYFDRLDKQSSIISTSGPRGTVTVANTGSLLHCGGRVGKNGFRCFMLIHFCPTNRYVNPKKYIQDDWRMGLKLSKLLSPNEIANIVRET